MVGLMKFIYDSNLGFPIGQDIWQDFFTQGHCSVFGTNNIELMSQNLGSDSDLFAYIPVVCLYNLRKIPNIQGLVSATTGKSGSPTASSVLIVKQEAHLENLADLGGKPTAELINIAPQAFFTFTLSE